MPRLDRLDARYREHHSAEKQEFVFGGDERGLLINELVGVDVDSAALERARRRLGIETVHADAEDDLPFEDASFDVVVMGEILEHLAHPAAAVANVHRVLAPGGRFVGSVPNAFRLKSRVAYALGRYPGDWDPTHLQLFTPDALRALLAGFEAVEIRFVVGRFVRLHPRLLANDQVFSARKPG